MTTATPVVAYVTKLGYLHCSVCVASGCTSGDPVYADSHPHCTEKCDICGRLVVTPNDWPWTYPDGQSTLMELEDRSTAFRPGQRVTATLWGKVFQGIVTRHQNSNSIVLVRWDGQRKVSWVHPESLRSIT